MSENTEHAPGQPDKQNTPEQTVPKGTPPPQNNPDGPSTSEQANPDEPSTPEQAEPQGAQSGQDAAEQEDEPAPPQDGTPNPEETDDAAAPEQPDPEEALKAKKRKQTNLLIAAVAVLAAVMLILAISGTVGAVQSSGQSSSQAGSETEAPVSESDGMDSFDFQATGAGDTAEAESAVTAGTFSGSDSQAEQDSGTGSQSSDTDSQDSGVSSPQDTFSGAKISRDEFNALQVGMTYEDAASIIGSNGSLTLSTGNMRVYEWPGYGSSDGALARITFKSGRLAKKYQYGL